MKYTFLLLACAGAISVFFVASCTSTGKQRATNDSVSQIDDGHNSKLSLDWDASYYGILPCADCEGIEMVITLNDNNTFSLSRKYLGKTGEPINTRGTFTWAQDGNSVMLDKANDNRRLQVGENQLFWLDDEGNRITGSLANHYILRKISVDDILEKYWKLISLRDQPVKTFGKRESHIILKRENHKLIGNGGCNALTGSYMIAPQGKIGFTDVGSTEIACEALKTEQELIQVLQVADNYLINDDTLILRKGNMIHLARFEAVYLR